MVCDVDGLGLLGFTWPWLSTMMRSQLSTVCSLCAMVNVVQSWNELRMVSWIRESVSESIAAVASSKIRTYTEVEEKKKKRGSEEWAETIQAVFQYHISSVHAKVQPHGHQVKIIRFVKCFFGNKQSVAFRRTHFCGSAFQHFQSKHL